VQPIVQAAKSAIIAVHSSLVRVDSFCIAEASPEKCSLSFPKNVGHQGLKLGVSKTDHFWGPKTARPGLVLRGQSGCRMS
jgi:hypothetical protein